MSSLPAWQHNGQIRWTAEAAGDTHIGLLIEVEKKGDVKILSLKTIEEYMPLWSERYGCLSIIMGCELRAGIGARERENT